MRDFVDTFYNNPSKFTYDIRTSAIALENNNDISISINFVKEVEPGNIFNRKGVDVDHVLQALDTSTKFRNITLSTSEHT